MGTVICKFPIPADRITTSSLSPCILDRPIITPVKTAIGQVKAITFGTNAKVNCQTKFDGRIVLKKMSEKRLACWTKRMTLSKIHEKKK